MHWNDAHLMFADRQSPFVPLADIVEKLMQPEIVAQLNVKDAWGRTPLYYALSVHPEAVEVLLRSGANPFLAGLPSRDAAYLGASAAVGPLIRAGDDVNARDADGRGALHWAAIPPDELVPSSQISRAALELVRHGGHILRHWDTEDRWKQTPLDIAEWSAEEFPHDAALQAIFKLYKTRAVPPHARYIDAPAAVDADGDITHPTSLICAGLRGAHKTIGELIRLGAMVNERDDEGHTLLHLVAMGRVQDGYRVVLELVRHGGYGLDWDALTTERRTALELARERLGQEDREDARRVVRLLEERKLPHGERYIFPCMDTDYCRRCSSISECMCDDFLMPGAFV